MAHDMYLQGDDVEGWCLYVVRTRIDVTPMGLHKTTVLSTPAPVCPHLHNSPQEARQCPIVKAKRHLYGS